MAKKSIESGMWDEEIDGRVYSFSKWGSETQVDVLIDLSKIVGKPFGLLAEAAQHSKGKNLLDQDLDVLASVFDALTTSMDKKICTPLIKKLASEGVLCDGVKINSFNEHYKEDLMHLFHVVKAALEVQYGNFFNAAKGLATRKPTTAAVTNQVSAT